MEVAHVTLEYNGRGWFCVWHTDPSAHSLGVGAHSGTRVVLGPVDGPLDLQSSSDLLDAMYDSADTVIKYLVEDLVLKLEPESAPVQNPLPF